MTSDYLIYIGRFQPLHQGHLRTIGQALDATVARHGDREALVVPHQGVRWTWRQPW